MIGIGDIERLSWTARDARQRRKRRRAPLIHTLEIMLRAMEARDPYMCGHALRVSQYSVALAAALGQKPRRLEEFRIGGLLHDIGKIGVLDSILQKAGALSANERHHVEKHPEVGAAIVENTPFMRPILPFILFHHERWDGKGYPAKLQGHEIPLKARVCAIADALDAMTSSRPHRAALTLDRALSQLSEGRGTQFDPQCVDALFAAIESGVIRPAP
jgi:putative nucleotidyltransferase with HDIG domain